MRPEDVPAELVEKAARADWDRGQQIKRDLYGDAPIAWGDAHESHRILHRNKVRPILAAVLPEYGAQVLEDAADDLDLPGSTATGYYASEAVGGYNDAERDIEAWLVKRAARLTATSEEPSDG